MNNASLTILLWLSSLSVLCTMLLFVNSCQIWNPLQFCYCSSSTHCFFSSLYLVQCKFHVLCLWNLSLRSTQFLLQVFLLLLLDILAFWLYQNTFFHQSGLHNFVCYLSSSCPFKFLPEALFKYISLGSSPVSSLSGSGHILLKIVRLLFHQEIIHHFSWPLCWSPLIHFTFAEVSTPLISAMESYNSFSLLGSTWTYKTQQVFQSMIAFMREWATEPCLRLRGGGLQHVTATLWDNRRGQRKSEA